jgi:TP901 family phage tail tape measure protein
MATLSSRLMLSMTDGVTGPAKRVEASLAGVQRRAGLASRAFGAMGRYVGGIATAAAPLAAGFGAIDTIRTAADFETRLTEIAKKGGLSADALAKVKSEILGIVESGKVAMGPAEIAGAYERGIAAGIPLEKMRAFTILSTKAADAWGMTGEEVGNAFAGFGAGMGLGFDQMERYADLINTLADSGISDEKDIVKFLDNAGATLQAFGMSREQIAAYGSTLLNLKMPAEVAARAMNTLSTKMLTPKATKQSTKAFASLYGSADKFAGMLKEDANGALKDFLGKLQGLDKFRRAEILTGILGQGFSDEINRLVEGLPELERNLKLAVTPELYVGSLDESYQKKLDTMEAKWKIFKANLDKLQIDLGHLVLPAASDFLGDMTRGANELSDAIDGIGTTWKVLKDAVNGTPEVPGDFDPKGRNWLDPWGVKARERADGHTKRAMKDMANNDRSKDAPALGAFGARDMDGVTSGKLLAGARNEIRRVRTETPREKSYLEYTTKRVDGHRSAERDSMEALKRQFGEYLSRDGQSFQKGTAAGDLVDEALSAFGDAVFVATAVIREATGKTVEPADVAREAGIPIPTAKPIPTPSPRPSDAASAEPSSVKITDPVTTRPSGVQDVNITNPTPVHAPINVTVYATTNASADEIGAAVGARVKSTVEGSYSDGGGGW